MAFGQKQGSLKNLKKSLAKGGGKGFIKFIPKNGAMNVRFIEEPEEWVNYVEHYDQMARKSFPCNGESSCPGCVSGERKSSRYLANVVDRDDKDRVVPLQMPKDLANRLVIKYEKWGTITDRDIELSRSGEGLDTVYDLDAAPADRRRIDKFQPIDLMKVLEDAYNAIFAADDDDIDAELAKEEEKRAIRPRKKSAAAPKGTTLDDEPEDEDEPEEEAEDEAPAPKPAKKAAKKAPAKAPEPVFEEDDDEDEDEEEAEDEPDEEYDEYDEETLRALPLGALRAVAKEFNVATRGKDQDTLIEEILSSDDEG